MTMIIGMGFFGFAEEYASAENDLGVRHGNASFPGTLAHPLLRNTDGTDDHIHGAFTETVNAITNPMRHCVTGPTPHPQPSHPMTRPDVRSNLRAVVLVLDVLHICGVRQVLVRHRTSLIVADLAPQPAR